MKLGTLCYLKKDSKTLMIHRVKRENDFHRDKYNGLGGKFEPGETPEECAVREVKEESGFIIKNPVLKGIITFPNFDGIDDWYVFIFVIKEFEGKMIDSPEGYLEWVEDEELLDLPLWEGDKIFIPWFNQDKFFSAKFVYENKKLKNWNVVFY